jgi:hypothetical protein
MGGSNSNEITANTRSMRDAVDHAVEGLKTANSNSINDVVHDIDRQILQNQYKVVIDPLFGDPATHQNTYSRAFTSLLNQKLEEQGLLPQVLMTFGENKDNYMALSSGDKYIHNDTLALAVADYDGSQSYVEAQLARDMQEHKGALEHAKGEFAVGALRIGGREGISRGRLEAYAKEGNDVAGAKAMLSQFDTPEGFNRLSHYKPGAYIDRSDIQSMLAQNSNSLSPDQVRGLEYMAKNYDKIAVKGVDPWDPGKRGITHEAIEAFAAKRNVTWDVVNADRQRQEAEQQVLDASIKGSDDAQTQTVRREGGTDRNRSVQSPDNSAKPKALVTDGMGRDWQFKNLDASGNPQLVVEPDGAWHHVQGDQWRNGNKVWFGTIKAQGSDWVKTGRDGRIYTIHADGSLQNDYLGIRSEMDADGRVKKSFINGPEIRNPVDASLEFKVANGVTKSAKIHFEALAAGANHDPDLGDYATVKSRPGNAVVAMAGGTVIYAKSAGAPDYNPTEKLSEVDQAAIKKQLALTPDNQGVIVMKIADPKHHAVRYVTISGLSRVCVKPGDEPEAGTPIAQVGNDGTFRMTLRRFRAGGPTVPIETQVTRPRQDQMSPTQYRVREHAYGRSGAGNDGWSDYYPD